MRQTTEKKITAALREKRGFFFSLTMTLDAPILTRLVHFNDKQQY